VGLAVQAACRALGDADQAVPSFPAMSPSNVVLKLRSQEGNDTFFRELVELCSAVQAACAAPGLAALADALLVPAAAETGVKCDRHDLAAACGAALGQIHEVVDHDGAVGTGFLLPDDSEDAVGGEGEGGGDAVGAGAGEEGEGEHGEEAGVEGLGAFEGIGGGGVERGQGKEGEADAGGCLKPAGEGAGQQEQGDGGRGEQVEREAVGGEGRQELGEFLGERKVFGGAGEGVEGG
jgi:hypothetical protein